MPIIVYYLFAAENRAVLHYCLYHYFISNAIMTVLRANFITPFTSHLCNSQCGFVSVLAVTQLVLTGVHKCNSRLILWCSEVHLNSSLVLKAKF
jgi:hypothetical protein